MSGSLTYSQVYSILFQLPSGGGLCFIVRCFLRSFTCREKLDIYDWNKICI